MVFDENDKSLFREYSLYQRLAKHYRCQNCYTKFNLYVWAKLITDDEGNEVVELGPKEHQCELKGTRIIQKSNFKTDMAKNKKGREVKIQTITDPFYDSHVFTFRFHSRNQCFYCTNCGKKQVYVKATFRENQNGEECIELSDDKHVCL
uniref:Uncharacterized protein n=1 Tax=Panagrolaimus sp. ES5 TaxID=591445 RepID=A0AC34FJT5_9BILA